MIKPLTLTAFFISLSLFISTASAISQPPATGYTETKHPIVLIHGFMGSSNYALIDYFYGIEEELRNNGATVYAPSLPAINTTEERGDYLITLLKQLQNQYGYEKFNLIGHSHGGLNARYVLGKHPEIVASITTMGTPHNGSFPSDHYLENPDDFWQKVLRFFTVKIPSKIYQLIGFGNNLGSCVFDFFTGNEQTSLSCKFDLMPDMKGYLNSTSTAGVEKFNQAYPVGLPTTACGEGEEYNQETDTYLYSFSGNKTDVDGWNKADPFAWLMHDQAKLIDSESDGWIERCSSHFGKVKNDNLQWNHIDETNQVLGTLGVNAEDPITVYKTHVNSLKNLDL